MDIKLLRDIIDGLFTKRSSLMTLWQEIAENFYPERADFTVRRAIGDSFAGNLMTSYPVLTRRDLGDQFGTMLRPTNKEWMEMVASNRSVDNDSTKWLQWATGIQRRAQTDRVSQFSRAMKEADHDIATFGAAVISCRLNKNRNALLYRTYHLRDTVWIEDENGTICLIARKWNPYAKDLQRIFGSKNHTSLTDRASKAPLDEVNCYHIIVDAEMYDSNAGGKPFFSIYYDITHNHLIEEVAQWNKEYAIPRWQTVSGSQYPFSPATITALPDARLIQTMTATLLDAGENAVRPPLIATKDAVKSDVGLYSGGITWVDQDYDERLGEALRPVELGIQGIPLGVDMMRDSRQLLMQAFYLNKLTLPERAPDMTAYEVGQRVQEYIRGALPIFEPMEQECNGQVSELTFDLLMRGGAFGSMNNLPDGLKGAEISFRFMSPLHDAIEAQKGHLFLESGQLISAAMQLDQSSGAIINAKDALRDVLDGIKVPATWLNSKEEVKQSVEALKQAQAMQQKLAMAQQGGEAAANITQAKKNAAEANAIAA